MGIGEHPQDPGEPQDGSADPAGETRFTRRQAVVSGAAFGAAVVWTSQFPFADAAIGQVIRATGLGPTGTTGPTGPAQKESSSTTAGSTGSTGSTGATGTGSTGTSTPPFGFPKLTVAANGEMTLTIRFPSGGDFDLLVTNANSLARVAGLLKPGRGRSAFARAHAHSPGPGTVHLKARPTQGGATLLRRRRSAGLSTPLRAYATFTPTHGRATTLYRHLTLKAPKRH